MRREGHSVMSPQIQFRDLRASADTALIEAIYSDILGPSFDRDELDPLDIVLDGLSEDGSYACWGLCALDGDEPVGCILGYPHLVSRVLLIGYVAVKRGLRSRGIGGKLLDEAGRRWYGKAGLTLVLAEIDDPRYHPAKDGIDPQRRVDFYAKHQTQIVVGPYFQPQLGEGGRKRVYDMFLAVLPRSDRATDPRNKTTVEGRQLVTFLREYFTAAGEDSDWPAAEDAEGRWLLDYYRTRDHIDLCPIDKYQEAAIPRVQDRPAP